ncbi:MAG: TrpR-related protein YerC/YecD [Oscillospiraceae bacterium]|nr:TrpR-related protein YerC/YecD [Candidatus Equicaccousia limihippi]
MSNIQNNSIDRLFKTISALEDENECRAFFEDLCTIKEIQDMAQRLDTAVLLSKGYSYQKIADEVKISTATICRVNRALNYGSDGYKKVIEKTAGKEKQNEN